VVEGRGRAKQQHYRAWYIRYIADEPQAVPVSVKGLGSFKWVFGEAGCRPGVSAPLAGARAHDTAGRAAMAISRGARTVEGHGRRDCVAALLLST
jgi:hypothetical protein